MGDASRNQWLRCERSLLTNDKRERRARKLQERVAAAIDSAVSDSPASDDRAPPPRKGRNKCDLDGRSAMEVPRDQSPTVVYGGINMTLPPMQHSSWLVQGPLPGGPTHHAARGDASYQHATTSSSSSTSVAHLHATSL